MKLILSIIIFFLILTSCQVSSPKKVTQFIKEKKEIIKNNIKEEPKDKNESIFYYVGEPYYIEGIEYIPAEDYNYNKNGLSTYYGKELHNIKTINNDYNKVTELLGRHKTLPLPSTVRITNLENGLSLIIKINDRHEDNSSIIQVSRKVAQLLKFYKNKIARVNVEIIEDPSKQMKIVTMSMNEPKFNETISSAPTEIVSISDLNETNSDISNNNSNFEQPIELKQNKISDSSLFLKVYGFDSYQQSKEILKDLNINFKTTVMNEGNNYSIVLGPLENKDINLLVSSFISIGYKQNEIIVE